MTGHATSDRVAPVELPLTITCMIEAHGPLHAYLTADGKVAVRACDFCKNAAYFEGRETAAIEWKLKIAAALGEATR